MKPRELDALIRGVCPIDGINSAGAIQFLPEATEGQRAAAQALMDTHLGDLSDAPTHTDQIDAQIDALERQALLPRVVREDLLLRFETVAAGAGIARAALLNPQDPHYAPGYAKVYAFNEQIKALRAQR